MNSRPKVSKLIIPSWKSPEVRLVLEPCAKNKQIVSGGASLKVGAHKVGVRKRPKYLCALTSADGGANVEINARIREERAHLEKQLDSAPCETAALENPCTNDSALCSGGANPDAPAVGTAGKVPDGVFAAHHQAASPHQQNQQR